MNSAEERFERHLQRLRVNPEARDALQECLDALRDMNADPRYRLGELAATLNARMLRLAETSGLSYESIYLSILGPRFRSGI